MTEEQFNKLPLLFQEIVTTQREMDTAFSGVVGHLETIAGLMSRKEELITAAARQYGHKLTGDEAG